MNMIEVTAIIFDWFYTDESGEDFTIWKVGDTVFSNKITEIFHRTGKDGHYCEVMFDNGAMQTIYNLNRVVYGIFK